MYLIALAAQETTGRVLFLCGSPFAPLRENSCTERILRAKANPETALSGLSSRVSLKRQSSTISSNEYVSGSSALEENLE
jgi:hypothetical protein